jgi:putative oxidoreductase
MTSPRLESRLASNSSAVISLFRLVIGLLFAIHGSTTLFDWPVASPVPVNVGDWPGWWSGLIEFVTGLLVALGLFTRPAAFLASGTMAVAYFWMHWPGKDGGAKGFWPIENGGELAVIYCFAFFMLVFIGPGTIAIDARMRRRGPAAGYAAPRQRPGLMSRFRR